MVQTKTSSKAAKVALPPQKAAAVKGGMPPRKPLVYQSKPGQCCKACVYLDVPADANGTRRVWPKKTYPCVYPLPRPPLPDSITRAHGYPMNPTQARQAEPTRSPMLGEDGETCPTFEAKPPYKRPGA